MKTKKTAQAPKGAAKDTKKVAPVKKSVAPTPRSKKPATKKVLKSSKASIPAKKPKRTIAPEEKRFWMNGGGILRDLKDLHTALLSMSPEQFAYHTRGGSNHFALWVEAVLHDRSCAQGIAKAKTQKAAAAKVADALKKYR